MRAGAAWSVLWICLSKVHHHLEVRPAPSPPSPNLQPVHLRLNLAPQRPCQLHETAAALVFTSDEASGQHGASAYPERNETTLARRGKSAFNAAGWARPHRRSFPSCWSMSPPLAQGSFTRQQQRHQHQQQHQHQQLQGNQVQRHGNTGRSQSSAFAEGEHQLSVSVQCLCVFPFLSSFGVVIVRTIPLLAHWWNKNDPPPPISVLRLLLPLPGSVLHHYHITLLECPLSGSLVQVGYLCSPGAA